MISTESPRAILGAALQGRLPLRYIYLDESGTSGQKREKFRVVAGIIVQPDESYVRLEQAIRDLREDIPNQYRSNLIIHSTDILNSRKLDEGWSLSDRIEFLKRAMAIPLSVGAAVVYGMILAEDKPHETLKPLTMKRVQFEHAMALNFCLCEADEYLRKYTHPDEVGTVIYEDLSGPKDHLKTQIEFLRFVKYAQLYDGRIVPLRQAIGTPHRVVHVNRIRDSLMFQDKKDSPFLQLADVCAWGFRRFFDDLPGGDDYFKAITHGADPLQHPVRRRANSPDAVACGQYSYFTHPRRDNALTEALGI